MPCLVGRGRRCGVGSVRVVVLQCDHAGGLYSDRGHEQRGTLCLIQIRYYNTPVYHGNPNTTHGTCTYRFSEIRGAPILGPGIHELGYMNLAAIISHRRNWLFLITDPLSLTHTHTRTHTPTRIPTYAPLALPHTHTHRRRNKA